MELTYLPILNLLKSIKWHWEWKQTNLFSPAMLLLYQVQLKHSGLLSARCQIVFRLHNVVDG